MEGDRRENIARISVSSTGNLMKEIWKTKLYTLAAQKNKQNNTMSDRVCYCCFVSVRASRTIRRGKHSDIFRPSYSNQKIKVPFSPAVATTPKSHGFFFSPRAGRHLLNCKTPEYDLTSVL